MRERALFLSFVHIHGCAHSLIDAPVRASILNQQQAANRGRLPSGDTRMIYRVADQHLPFARLLKQLRLPLVAVPNDLRFYLGVRCDSEAQAQRRTIDIFRELTRRPRVARALQNDLKLWRARRVEARLTLWWPGVEVWKDWIN